MIRTSSMRLEHSKTQRSKDGPNQTAEVGQASCQKQWFCGRAIGVPTKHWEVANNERNERSLFPPQ